MNLANRLPLVMPLHLPFNTHELNNLTILHSCLPNVKDWMAAIFPQLELLVILQEFELWSKLYIVAHKVGTILFLDTFLFLIYIYTHQVNCGFIFTVICLEEIDQ